ncbi:MAG: cell wall-binding repeat-containing protein [Acidimicrobiales bacterium]
MKGIAVGNLVRRSFVIAVAVAIVLCLGAAVTAVPGIAGAQGLTNPSSNIPACSPTYLKAINCARATEGVAPIPYSLTTLIRLTLPEQIFAMTNLERTGRGLPPITGMTLAFNSAVTEAIDIRTDPRIATSAVSTWRSNWSAATVPMAADFTWMYEDGYGPTGQNLDCTSPTAASCWGHRDNILHSFPSCVTGHSSAYMDAVDHVGGSNPGLADIVVEYCGSAGPSTVTVTWAEVQQKLGGTTTPSGHRPFIRISGPTADATAAAELEHQFTYKAGDCPGTASTRPVILATDANYPDALASAYLARYLGTGVLLTPTASLSPATLTAIHEEGITKVYVVGGPLAISTAVVNELKSTPTDGCGGSSTTVGDVQVTRIAGTTQYTTAEKIAEAPPSSDVGTASFTGAYAGSYNDTTGHGSSAPSTRTALRTAVVATGKGYQDAESASTMAYDESFPILLTTPSRLSPQVSSAISVLGIRQIVVMGGTLAISNAVVTELESLGVSVLRVAGRTYSGTSVELAKFETAPSPDGLGWTGTSSLTIARGNGFTDGLAGAVVSADGPSCTAPQPLVLTLNPTSAGSALAGFLHTAGTTGIGGARVDTFTVLGGVDAVATATVTTMEGAL